MGLDKSGLRMGKVGVGGRKSVEMDERGRRG